MKKIYEKKSDHSRPVSWPRMITFSYVRGAGFVVTMQTSNNKFTIWRAKIIVRREKRMVHRADLRYSETSNVGPANTRTR